MERESEPKESKFGRICVFCGSSQGKKTSYQDAAIELGKELVHALFSPLPPPTMASCFFSFLCSVLLLQCYSHIFNSGSFSGTFSHSGFIYSVWVIVFPRWKIESFSGVYVNWSELGYARNQSRISPEYSFVLSIFQLLNGLFPFRNLRLLLQDGWFGMLWLAFMQMQALWWRFFQGLSCMLYTCTLLSHTHTHKHIHNSLLVRNTLPFYSHTLHLLVFLCLVTFIHRVFLPWSFFLKSFAFTTLSILWFLISLLF